MPRRDDLLAAGRELLAEADLAALTGFLGPRPLAARAGSAAATVTHHFPPDGTGAPAARAVLLSALAALDDERSALVADDRPTPARDRTAAVRRSLADGLRRVTPGDPQALPSAAAGQVASLLLAAAAPRDRVAREAVAGYHADRSREVRDLLEGALVLLGRRWQPGVGAASFAATLLALVQGFSVHQRFDPDGSPPELFADMALRLFAACTEPVDPAGGPSLATHERLVPRQRARVEAAVRELYAAGGWSHVDLRTVCRRAGVGREGVLATYGSLEGLAVVLWADRVPPLRLAAERVAGLDVDERAWEVLLAVASSAFADRALTVALLRHVNDYAAVHGVAGDDGDDPRNLVPVDLVLADVLADHPEAFWPDVTGSPPTVRESAGLLVLTLMLLAVRRPGWAPRDVAERVFRTTWAGMRVERPLHP